MFPIGELLPLIAKSFFSVLLNPFFWIFVGVVAFLYRKMGASTRYLYQTPGVSPRRLIVLALISGVGGGFLGSILLILVGISVNNIGGLYLFFIALGLMLIQQRFLCFAYAGGVLSLLHLLWGVPPEISVPQVMALVAILHLVEALLIFLTGSIYPLPIYVSARWNGGIGGASGKMADGVGGGLRGDIVGGFNLQKFWPLPLVIFFVGLYPDPQVLKGLVSMPDWWPLIKPELGGAGGGSELVYSMLAVPAVLGYGDIATTTTPRTKTRRAAGELAVYSVLLLLLAITAGYLPFFAYLAALFGPLGHEALIYMGRSRERRGRPLYVPVEEGLKLLHVWGGSPFAKAGLGSGDILLTVNDWPVHTDEELREALRTGWGAGNTAVREGIAGERGGIADRIDNTGNRAGAFGEFGDRIETWYRLTYRAAADGQIRQTAVCGREGEHFGYIPVPGRETSKYLAVSTSHSMLRRWWEKGRRKWRRK